MIDAHLLSLIINCLEHLPLKPNQAPKEFSVRLPKNVSMSAEVATDQGWSVGIVEPQGFFQCKIPDPVQTCMEQNPNCPKFDFIFQLPNQKSGIKVSFDGKNLKDHARTARLGAEYSLLAAGTVNAKGEILKMIENPANPVLGLSCERADRPNQIDQLLASLAKETSGLPTAALQSSCAQAIKASPAAVSNPDLSPPGAAR